MLSRLELFLLLPFTWVECAKPGEKAELLKAVLVSAECAGCNKWRRHIKKNALNNSNSHDRNNNNKN